MADDPIRPPKAGDLELPVIQAGAAGERIGFAGAPGVTPAVKRTPPGLEDSPRLTLQFFVAAIFISLAAGMLPGFWLLLVLMQTGTFAALPPHWVQVHAEAQIMGLLACFIFGFGYQAFPRFRGMKLQKPGLAQASLPLLVAGILGRVAGDLLAGEEVRWARPVALAGALLELAAVVLFAWVLAETGRQESPRKEHRPGAASHAGFAISSGAWLLVAAILGVFYAWFVGGEPAGGELVWRSLRWGPAFRDIQMHGVFYMMIVGVAVRLVPGFLQLPPDSSDRPLGWLPWLNAAVVAEAAGDFWMMRGGGNAALALRTLAALTLGVGALAIVAPLGVYSKRAAPSGPRPFVRAAFFWLAVSFALTAAVPAYRVLRGLLPAHEYGDAARHAFTMGFAMMMVMGVSSMVGPALSVQKRLPPIALQLTWWLLNAAVLLRVGGELWSEFNPVGYVLAGFSGPLALAAFLAWAIPLLACISKAPAWRGFGLPPAA